MYYVNWKLLFEFGFIFFVLMCALNYFAAERQFNVTESDSLYHYPIVQEIIEKQVQEKVNKLQPNNNSLKFHVGFFIFNILIFVLSLLHCKIIQFCFHLALKCQFDLKKIFVKQTFFPPKKSSFSKIPVLLNKTNRKSDSNLEIICRQSENVKSANCIEAKLNHKNKSCEMIFKNRRFSSNNHNLQINCEKLREEIIKLQTNSLKEQTALTRKLENALKERKELSRHLELIYKENSAAKEQLKQLVDEKTILLKRLENVTKELKLSTTTKKVALARLEEVTENLDKLQCQLEQIKRDKEIAEDKFHLLEVEYIKLQDGETKTNGCNHFLCAPERDEIEKFQEPNNLAIADSTLPQTEFDMQKIKKRITNLEKCLDSFNVVNVKFENVGLESDISSTFLDNDSLFHEDYSQMILDSSRSERRTEINLSYHESMEIPRRISNGVIVKLPTGKILGRQDISLKRNVTFYTFLQIPYGQPPIGKLRFMPPRPVEKWHGTLNCTQNTKICYQVGQNDDRGTEDCLYLNVYTPVEPGQNASLSVMFYIFGGGFYEGNALFSEYGPHYFMEEEVVIVTVSYRLGPFGFLSTNDEVILGNAGLKDQNLALKWVQKNIHLFGGDPKKVTIFGNSAGAASVSCHILSQKSVGLFRAGIGQSGSSLTIWSYARSARSVAYQMAADINSSFNNDSSSEELLNFLQNVNASELNAVLTNFTIYVSNEQGLEGSSYFGVVVEPDVEDAFITSLMYESIANGNFTKVPIMLGICSEESLYRAESIGDLKNFIQYIEADSASLVVSDFHIKDINRKRLVGNLTRKIYTDGLFIDDLPAALKFFSDTSICRSAIRHAQLQSNYTDVYFYQFSYHGQLGQNDIYVEGADRVYHTEDMKYLWCSNNVSNIAEYYPQSDVTTLERYVRLFTNFAKYLNPTPKPEDLLQNIAWPKLVPNNLTYLNINTTLEIKENPKAASYGKFVDLYDKYAVKPLDTY